MLSPLSLSLSPTLLAPTVATWFPRAMLSARSKTKVSLRTSLLLASHFGSLLFLRMRVQRRQKATDTESLPIASFLPSMPLFLSICVVATCCRRHPVLHGARPTFRDRVYEPLPVPERKEAETEKPRPRTGKRDPTQFSRTPVPVRRSKA